MRAMQKKLVKLSKETLPGSNNKFQCTTHSNNFTKNSEILNSRNQFYKKMYK
jgi:hypothetical protein